MSKHNDDLHDKAGKLVVAVTPPTMEEHAQRLHGVPGKVDAAALAVIRRAVTLQAALLGEMNGEDAEKVGRWLSEICRFYLTQQSARLKEKE